MTALCFFVLIVNSVRLAVYSLTLSLCKQWYSTFNNIQPLALKMVNDGLTQSGTVQQRSQRDDAAN